MSVCRRTDASRVHGPVERFTSKALVHRRDNGERESTSVLTPSRFIRLTWKFLFKHIVPFKFRCHDGGFSRLKLHYRLLRARPYIGLPSPHSPYPTRSDAAGLLIRRSNTWSAYFYRRILRSTSGWVETGPTSQKTNKTVFNMSTGNKEESREPIIFTIK